ncbi:T9SS type A sorting domain-containing protein [Neolewinella aurantiaca]|uniref:T9SS type A sorting domain-containing protein n=1 Tax=Neolewinella aurantiaca TaxID=2602767 RepID=A0A5C7FGH0_9BACT|nr:T9SS type A sorting domain-containing protein [Neolewinella aurantiaca]TXF90070.1 T9SS type A sorting domain-containing protein [Neolewinella aurantiaca]
MKNLFLLLICAFATTLSAQDVVDFEVQDVQSRFILGLAVPYPAQYDVQSYKVLYTTTDAFGQPDTASGLVTVPITTQDFLFPLAVYNHGTVGEREAVPSRPTVQERLVAAAISTAGYITIAPDYIGLGDSEGPHPYVHAATEASAGRDMIIAVKKWLTNESISAFNDQLFITGYSQGGHAAAALHRDIATNPGDDGLVVTSASHLSGPYSISEVMVGTLFQQGNATLPGYIAYTYISYDYVYGLFDSLSQAFVEPYLEPIERFANEETTLDEFNDELDQLLRNNNARLNAIFQDSIRAVLQSGDPTHPINIALADNDTYDWAPEEPTLIYYCTADEQVPFRNAILADSVMRANGSTSITLESGGAQTHGNCVFPALIRTIGFWEEYAEVISSLGVPVERADLTLSPNPVFAGQDLTLAGQETAIAPYSIYDASGREVSTGTTGAAGSLRIPAHLQSGLHVLRVGLPDGTSVVRRVVVR